MVNVYSEQFLSNYTSSIFCLAGEGLDFCEGQLANLPQGLRVGGLAVDQLNEVPIILRVPESGDIK